MIMEWLASDPRWFWSSASVISLVVTAFLVVGFSIGHVFKKKEHR